MDILFHANSPQKNATDPAGGKEPTLLAQGTYGCVYYPGFTCKGKIQKKKYITKLQKNNETLENEWEIGEKIKTLKHYKHYFAPILKKCPVTISNIKSTTNSQPLNKCNVVKEELEKESKNQSHSDFNLNKVRYILGKDLDISFKQVNIANSKAQSPLLFLTDTFKYLYKGLQKLKKVNVIHFDLKANNIIYDTVSNTPIIIDFGLSIPVEQINPTAPVPSNLIHYFFNTYEYDYWCLEPIFIGLIAYQYRSQSQIDSNLKVATLSTNFNQTIDSYISYAYVFKPEFQNKLSQLFPQNQPIQNTIQTFNKTFHDKWHNWIEEHNADTLQNLYQQLWNSKFTWDHYSLAVIYLDLLSELAPFPANHPQLPLLESFTQILLKQILSLPQERLDNYSLP